MKEINDTNQNKGEEREHMLRMLINYDHPGPGEDYPVKDTYRRRVGTMFNNKTSKDNMYISSNHIGMREDNLHEYSFRNMWRDYEDTIEYLNEAPMPIPSKVWHERNLINTYEDFNEGYFSYISDAHAIYNDTGDIDEYENIFSMVDMCKSDENYMKDRFYDWILKLRKTAPKNDVTVAELLLNSNILYEFPKFISPEAITSSVRDYNNLKKLLNDRIYLLGKAINYDDYRSIRDDDNDQYIYNAYRDDTNNSVGELLEGHGVAEKGGKGLRGEGGKGGKMSRGDEEDDSDDSDGGLLAGYTGRVAFMGERKR